MVGQGRSQTAIVLTLGAVLVLLLILFAAMAINDQRSRIKHVAADVQTHLNPPAPASTAVAIPPSLPQPPRRFPLAKADDADRVAPKAEPVGNPASWFSYDDYPADARRREVEGRVAARLKIDVHGKPRACAIVTGSGSVILDDATCDIAMRRGRFTPARDANGKAIRGSWPIRVSWRIAE